MRNKLMKWKQPTILLTSAGIAGVGDFIYLVAINILVFQMTGSATAVAGLWIITPAVNVLTKFWTGSFIDYRSKRKIMIATYLARAVLVFCIPFLPSIWFIYIVLVGLSIAQAFFIPSSMTYTTQLIPKEIRKRYNSIRSLTSSGAFIIGPAIAGTLILISDVDTALFLNASSFILAALLLILLPETDMHDKESIPSLSVQQIKEDFSISILFIKENSYVAIVYMTFIAMTLFAFAADTQEVVFTQSIVGLSETDYSLLISITGIGSVIGAFLVSIFSNQFSLRYLISIGIFMQTVGYIIYAFAWSFLSIAVGFIILGFFNTFLNAGIVTFYQNNVPVHLMGRVTSIFQLLQSFFQIVLVLLVGTVAEIIPLRVTIIILVIGMLLASAIVIINVFKQKKERYFIEC
ncbi:MFS transporter [Ornithinibacillus contaminans]|uniref:MFS transporter n=1 Tax=Ornithinibacillus contaminans TaxID=694055 RepID=UPI00064DD967|nr:MFS transporter [Ornithinibacillus contaminans]